MTSTLLVELQAVADPSAAALFLQKAKGRDPSHSMAGIDPAVRATPRDLSIRGQRMGDVSLSNERI
jgi:hypothetical protein